MRGHVRLRGPDTWELRAYAGRDPLSGNKKYKTKTIHAQGRRQAEKALAAFVTSLQGAGATPSATGTFGDLIQRWIDAKSPDWSPANALTVRNTVTYYLKPLLPVRLERMSAADLDAFYGALRARGGRGGRPLAASTVRRVHSVVRAALEQGVRWGWLGTNPAANASPGSSERVEVKSPDPAQILALLQRAERDDPAFALFLVVAAVTGARRGELLAVRWSDLALDVGTLTITRAISEGADGPVERSRPKTTSSVRQIALDEVTVALLVAHRTRMTERSLDCGVSLPPTAFVFSHEPDCSLPWRPGFVSLKFRRLRHQLELDHVRLHDLRHFVATTLLAAGVDLRTVAGRLGHAGGGRTTLAVYAHFQQAANRAAAELLGRLLSTPAPELIDGHRPHGVAIRC